MDFFAVWLIPLDLWYIIPIVVATTTSLYLRPEKPKYGRGCRVERYRESWKLLETAASRKRRRRSGSSAL